jgi:alpha-N-acetylglucosamine transferase
MYDESGKVSNLQIDLFKNDFGKESLRKSLPKLLVFTAYKYDNIIMILTCEYGIYEFTVES